MFEKMYIMGYDMGYLSVTSDYSIPAFVNPYKKGSHEYNACDEGFNDGVHDASNEED